MGAIPMMGAMGGIGTDDMYTQMLYQQMMANGGGMNSSVWGNGWNGNNASGNAAAAAEQPAKSGFSIGGAAVGAAVGGGLGYAGMHFTNNMLNNPLTDKGKFNDAFMSKFSTEYAAMKRGDGLVNFFKGLGTSKVPVTHENFGATMESIEKFMKSGDVDDLTAEAKQVLKKQLRLSNLKKATLEAARADAGNLTQMRTRLVDNIYKVQELTAGNNLTAQRAMLDSLTDIREGWKSLGNGVDSVSAKIQFLRENAHSLGIDQRDYAKLLNNIDNLSEAELRTLNGDLNNMFNTYGSKGALKTRRDALNREISTIEKGMQKLAGKWDKKAGFWTKGAFKGADKKTLTALNNTLKSFRKSKALPVALGAAALGAIVSFFC